jgi:hypothetical protein
MSNNANFKYSVSGDSYKIESPEIATRKDMFALMHEIGHAYCKHIPVCNGLIDITDVDMEICAWSYVFNIIKCQFHNELMEFALYCINTYNVESEKSYGDFYSDAFIISKLKEGNL